MIQFRQEDILELNGMISSLMLSAEQKRQLEKFVRVRFTVLHYSHAHSFHLLLQQLLIKLLETNKIYFVYVESAPQLRTKMRSYRKMFYDDKKQGKLKASDLFEGEIEVSSKKTLLTSSIKISKQNIDYVLGNLLSSNFRFSYLVKKGVSSFHENQNQFLRTIVNQIDDKNKTTRINYLELTDQIGKGKGLFRLPFAANDKKYIEFIFRKDDQTINQYLRDVQRQMVKSVEN